MASIRVGLFPPDDQPLTGGPERLRAMLARIAEESVDHIWSPRESARGDPNLRAGWLATRPAVRLASPVPSSRAHRTVTVAGNLGEDVPRGTLASIWRQAGRPGGESHD
jgi:hypothetical protein